MRLVVYLCDRISSSFLMTMDGIRAFIGRSALGRLIGMYRDGFGNSPLARKLLVLILIKVAILFLVFKLFLMPNHLSRDYDTDEERAQGVRNELLNRGTE